MYYKSEQIYLYTKITKYEELQKQNWSKEDCSTNHSLQVLVQIYNTSEWYSTKYYIHICNINEIEKETMDTKIFTW